MSTSEKSNKMQKVIEFTSIVITTFFIVMMFVYGIDRELAMREYNEFGHTVTKCLFESNCQYYDNLKK